MFGGLIQCPAFLPASCPWRQQLLLGAGRQQPGPPPRQPAGIDFGAARSGYAFALGTDQVVGLQYSWPGELIQQPTNLTALLYDTATWRPIAWGMEAYKQ
jgi:hypothetical protein